MKFRLWAVLMLAPFSVARAQGPRIPGAVRVDAQHAEYFRASYDSVVRCTGMSRPFEKVIWYIVPGGSFRDHVQEALGEQRIRYWGETVFPDTIYVAEVRPEWVARHELIHYLRQRVDHDDWLNSRCMAPYDSRFAPSTVMVKGE